MFLIISVKDKINIVIIIKLQSKHKGQKAPILNVSWYIKYELNTTPIIDIKLKLLKWDFIFLKYQNKAIIKSKGYTKIANTGKGIPKIWANGFCNTVEQDKVSFISQKLEVTFVEPVTGKYKFDTVLSDGNNQS